MINCAIYPRKSKAVDNSDSMETQIDMCLRYLDNKYGEGKYAYKIYDGDYGITGHSTQKRKDFLRMMDDVKSKKIQLVLVQRYDRLARNTRDFCNIYHEMEQAGCELVSVSQQIDTTTPYGKQFMYMQASMAELEWALCSERRKDSINYAISIGKCVVPDHTLPYGYKTEKINGMRKMVIDQSKKEIVTDLLHFYMKYHNYCRTARYINNKYGINITNHTIKNMVRSEFYKGKYRNNDNYCEPYLTPEEWDKLQESKKTVIRDDSAKKTEILFSGMLMCPFCNRRMRAIAKTKTKTRTYRYYHCEYHLCGTCVNKKVKSELLIEEMLLNKIENCIVDISLKTDKKEKPKKSADKYKKELDRLNTMFQKGRIDDDYYDKEYLRLQSLIDEISNEENKDNQVDIEKLQETFSGNWKELYMQLDPLHKKLFWREFIKEVHFTEDMLVSSIIFL